MKIQKFPISKKKKIAAIGLFTGAIAVPVCMFAKKRAK